GRSDLGLAPGSLTGQIQRLVVRQTQGTGAAQKQAVPHRNPLLFKLTNFFQQRIGRQHHGIPNNAGDVVPQDARRNQVQYRLLAVDDQRMTCVVSSLEAHDHTNLLGQQINDLALSLVTPLGAQNDDVLAHLYALVPVLKDNPLTGSQGASILTHSLYTPGTVHFYQLAITAITQLIPGLSREQLNHGFRQPKLTNLLPEPWIVIRGRQYRLGCRRSRHLPHPVQCLHVQTEARRRPRLAKHSSRAIVTSALRHGLSITRHVGSKHQARVIVIPTQLTEIEIELNLGKPLRQR